MTDVVDLLREAAFEIRATRHFVHVTEEWVGSYGLDGSCTDIPREDRRWMGLMHPQLAPHLAGLMETVAAGMAAEGVTTPQTASEELVVAIAQQIIQEAE